MYPYFTIRWLKLYMTGIGIVLSFITFVAVVWYLSKRNLQSFRKFFYWLPVIISLVYFLGSYTQFILSTQSFVPKTLTDIWTILSPYGYKFHFAGILLGIVTSLAIFFKNIKTLENKKVWADIFFFAFSLCLVPLWFFLLLGDNFVGNTTSSFLGMKSLHSESLWNKFDSVFPIGLFLSLGSLLVTFGIYIRKLVLKKKWLGLLWLAILLIVVNIVMMMQQYPRYMVISLWNISIDIKQHISFFVIMFCIYLYKKWNAPRLVIEE